MTHVYQGSKRCLASAQYVLNLGLLIGLGAFGGVAQAQIQFQDQPATDGLPYNGESFGASAGDFNADGWPDVYTNHHRLQGGIHRNNGSSGSRFTDVTLQLDSSDTWVPYTWALDKHGGSFGDFNNNGFMDFYSTNSAAGPSTTSAHLFVNEINQNGLFVNRASQFGVTDDSTGRQPVWWDYNSDGKLDLAVIALSSSKLFRQSSGGTSFSNRTSIDGFTCNGMFMQLADFNVDGRLDLICVSQSGGVYGDKILSPPASGTGPLTSIKTQVNFPATSATTDAAVADFDGDGRTDVFIVKGKMHPNEALAIGPNGDRAEAHIHISPPEAEGGFGFASTADQITVTLHAPFIDANEIYIGAGGIHPAAKTFTLDRTIPTHVGIRTTRSSQGLYAGFNVSTQRWEFWTAAGGIDMPSYIEAVGAGISAVSAAPGTIKNGDLPIVPLLLMNTASGFVDQTWMRGLGAAVQCNGVVAADFDNDKDQDLYLGCRVGVRNIANILYVNDGTGNFDAQAGPWGGEGAVGQGLASKTGTSESIVVADYNVDGRVDLVLTNGGRLVPERLGGPDELVLNTSGPNNWLLFDLVGTVSNRDAVGTKVTVTAGGTTQTLWQDGKYHRWSHSDKRIHVGLGGDTQATTIHVNWPRGFVDTFSNVQANALYRVTEGPASSTGTITPVTLGAVPALPPPQPGNEFGVPVYQASIHKGVFLYKNSSTQLWSMRMAAGGATSTVLFSGNLTSDQAFTNVAPFNLEGSDTFSNSPTTAIQFGFDTSFANIDGVDFKVGAGATNACLNLNLPANVPVMVGPDRKVAPMPFNLTNLQACAPPPPPPQGCGVPIIQNSVDKAIFLYKDCSTGIWTVRATAGGSPTLLNYNGSVTSNLGLGFTDVSEFSFEPPDSLMNSASQLSYSLNMSGGGIDGFSFKPASGDENCFGANLPAGAQVLIGQNREAAPTMPFNLNTFVTCN